MSYQKNDLADIEITDMGQDGEGIGHADGYALFVKDAVIGDVARVRLTKVKKNYAYARLEKVLTPSPFRVKEVCPCARACGGCQLQALSYERQLRYKEEKVRSHLVRIGGFSEEKVTRVSETIVGMENPFRYRNKAQYPIGYDKEGRPAAGFYAGRTHSIIPCADCLLGPAENKKIAEAFLSYMEEAGVSAYSEETGEGLVRHLMIRTGFASGEILVCVVANGERLPKEERLIERLLAPDLSTSATDDVTGAAETDLSSGVPAPRHIVGICLNCNETRGNVILGEETRTLWGRGYMEDELALVVPAEPTDSAESMQSTVPAEEPFAPTGERARFRISPQSFYQVNPAQTERLYGLALQYANLTNKETVIDLYCGIGTISLFLAKRAAKVYGVEVVPEAIRDARENARANGIDNVEFLTGKAEEILPALKERGVHADVIVVDPPRKGCDETCLQTMLAMEPARIVYISCDSATLARDLRILCDGGYELKRLRPVDQFGQTVHVETVCLLSKPRC